MAPGQRDPRLLAGKTTALNHLTGNFRRQGIDGPAENSDRHNRLTAHGENIADGVGRRDRRTVAEIVDGGIIAGFVAHQQIWVDKFGLVALQDSFQHFRGNFTPATGSVAVLR